MYYCAICLSVSARTGLFLDCSTNHASKIQCTKLLNLKKTVKGFSAEFSKLYKHFAPLKIFRIVRKCITAFTKTFTEEQGMTQRHGKIKAINVFLNDRAMKINDPIEYQMTSLHAKLNNANAISS